MDKVYIETKEDCEKKLIPGYVCPECGRTPRPIETVDNAGSPTYWLGCHHIDTDPDVDQWGKFTQGVPKEDFELAQKLVCEEGGYYSHLKKYEYSDTPERREYWFMAQTAGWCDLLRTLDYLKRNGSRVTKQEFLEDKYF